MKVTYYLCRTYKWNRAAGENLADVSYCSNPNQFQGPKNCKI